MASREEVIYFHEKAIHLIIRSGSESTYGYNLCCLLGKQARCLSLSARLRDLRKPLSQCCGKNAR